MRRDIWSTEDAVSRDPTAEPVDRKGDEGPDWRVGRTSTSRTKTIRPLIGHTSAEGADIADRYN
jgi:hypothetical protein